MDSLKTLLPRDFDMPSTEELTPTMTGLLVALLVLVLIGLSSVVALYFLRRVRNRRMADLEAQQTTHLQTGRPVSMTSKRGHRRTLTITSAPYAPPQISYVDAEKRSFMSSERSPPGSPVPEIHITFPEEKGEKRSSRVVVVQITDNGGVGLEPYKEEQLPQYEERQRKEEWRSLDLDKMGGLKEKRFG